MEKLGTSYGGWFIPKECKLNENSIIYSVGVGEDISFDLLLNYKYKCKIFLIDPTKRAIDYYSNVIKYFNLECDDHKLKNSYLKTINFKPNLNDFVYIDKGLWDSKTELKFYFQSNPEYVSQTFIQNMYTDNFYLVKTTSLKDIMEQFGHTQIDLLKLDIEGAEITVLEDMIKNNIFPKYLLVEFDLKLKNKDYSKLTESIIEKLPLPL